MGKENEINMTHTIVRSYSSGGSQLNIPRVIETKRNHLTTGRKATFSWGVHD